MPNARPMAEPFFARSALPAPRFWLTKVVSAMDMLMIGRNAIPSSFAKAPCPEIANAPNVLIFDWTTRFPMLMTEFWSPVGSPWTITWRIISLWKRSSFQWIVAAPPSFTMRDRHKRTLSPCAITVATAAPAALHLNPATKMRSRIMFTTEEKIR